MQKVQLLLLAAVAACSAPRAGREEVPPAEPRASAPAANPASDPGAPASLEGWRSERIALPPGFAPGMPSGDELLLFAPGMFDADAEDFWSYVFVMRVDQGDLRSDQLADLFEQYYDGLITAVAEGAEIDDDPASVMLAKQADGTYVGNVSLIDTFVTMERVELRAVIRVDASFRDSTYLEVLVSPQPEGHAIWDRLETAVASLEL